MQFGNRHVIVCTISTDEYNTPVGENETVTLKELP